MTRTNSHVFKKYTLANGKSANISTRVVRNNATGYITTIKIYYIENKSYYISK